MKAIGKFILLDLAEFDGWLDAQVIKRKISVIQQHHTYIPAYKQFNGANHFQLCQSMEQAHKERSFAEIAQNFTTFPNGKIIVCRSLNTIPAGIKGANSYGICIENVGNFATFENKHCLACNLLPVCFGPCSQKMVEFNGNDDDFEKICLKGGVIKIIDREIDCLK